MMLIFPPALFKWNGENMKLERENHGLERGPDWGGRLVQSMVETERKRPRQQEAERVRYTNDARDLSCHNKCESARSIVH